MTFTSYTRIGGINENVAGFALCETVKGRQVVTWYQGISRAGMAVILKRKAAWVWARQYVVEQDGRRAILA